MKTIHSLHRPWKVLEIKANKVLSQKGRRSECNLCNSIKKPEKNSGFQWGLNL